MGLEVATQGLGFVYPDGTRALRGVDLHFPAGQLVAIVGQNGSGKSTLVRHFVGLLRATEGRVLVGGRDVKRRNVAELARLVGICFQNPDRQIFAARVSAEVAFGARNLGLPRTDVERATSEALAAVGLASVADANPYDLGYSQRKLVALASILVMETPMVVLDEPTTGQDLEGAECVRRIVADLAAASRTVVAISHDMDFVSDFDRVVVMREGRVVLDGAPAEVFAERNWSVLRSTNLEAPFAARFGARLGLGPTPNPAAVVAALARSAGGG
jgi:energy-coupling factor transport system ATP-binding protein